MARLALLCFASLLSTAVLAGPTRRESGRDTELLRRIGKCDEKDLLFKAGHTYEYQYFGKAETGLGFGDAKSLGLAMDCRIQLAVPEPCEYVLKVQDCKVLEAERVENDENAEGFFSLEDEVAALKDRQASRRGYKESARSNEFSQQVTRFPVSAQVGNGEVQVVIAHEDENTWVLNFKKAILDALHTRTDAHVQKDSLMMQNSVQGLCPTKYSSRSSPSEIIELKDIDSCIQRNKESWQLSPLTPFWNMSLISALVKSESACIYQLVRQNGAEQYIKEMKCREVHRFAPLPWSTHVAAASANVTQVLQFIQKSSSAEQIDRDLSSKTLTSIIYEHENSTDIERKSSAENADEILKALVDEAVDGLNLETPSMFDDLLDEMRSADNLDNVISYFRSLQRREKDIAKYFLVQGLIQCNTPACIRSLTVLMQSKEIPEEIFSPVVLALALTNQQDPLFLEEIQKMCENKPSRSCALMVGALAYNLVDNDESLLEEPATVQPIRKSAEFLIDLIEDSQCRASSILDRADEESDSTKIILALKAIGNLGHVAQKAFVFGEEDNLATTFTLSRRRSRSDDLQAEKKIANCIEDKTLPSNVTIAAIHALRRFVPTPFIKEKLVQALDDDQKSLEVRMAACMAVVRVANDRETVRKILKVLEEERSDHVQAFMVSHLRSVLKSEDPHYKQVALIVRSVLEERGQKLPNIQARIPHSVHIELSKFYEVPFLDNEDNDFGAQIEGGIMYSTKSYIPKSVHLNISAQAWGDYINFIEVGADMKGAEDLVEKIVGPNGLLTKSKIARKAQETAKIALRWFEKVAYKYLKLENIQEISAKVMRVIQSKNAEEMINEVIRLIRSVNLDEIRETLSNLQVNNIDQLTHMLKKYFPRTEQIAKIMEKLKRLRLNEVTEESLVQILESSGMSRVKAEDLLRKLTESGINVQAATKWIRNMDLEAIQNKLNNLRVSEVEELIQSVLKKVKTFIREISVKYNLPDSSSVIGVIQRLVSNPSELMNLAKNAVQSGKNYLADIDFDEESDDEEEDTTESRRRHRMRVTEEEDDDDDETLGQTRWASAVKSMKRNRMEDEEDQFDLTVFLRIFGDELGFVSLNDFKRIFDLSKLTKAVKLRELWDDILDGFDVQPTIALKSESLHHIATGLGLPLQLTFNVTGIVTAHVKMQPQGTIRKSFIELEPSAAVQVVSGMSLDIPSIHSMATVSNMTAKSEFEVKAKIDIRQNSVEIDIEKPDEVLDLIQIRHEIKLVKDDDEFLPFEDNMFEKLELVDKCMPQFVEKLTGLQICADGETSRLKHIPILPIGPHEIRLSVQPSSESGFDRLKFAAKYDKQVQHNRLEFSLRAPSRQSAREARAVVMHHRQLNDLDFHFDIPEQSYPRVQLFMRNLARPQQHQRLGAEAGINVEYEADKKYNASVTAVYEYSGYSYARNVENMKVIDALKDLYLNYTLKASVQTPDVVVNVSTTTAKISSRIMMEHNLTYWISDRIEHPLVMKKLRVFEAEDKAGLTRITVRHGLSWKRDHLAHDLRASAKVLVFPESLKKAEQLFAQVFQMKVHRDLRHIGLHANTTILNRQHEIEFFNASVTVNNLAEVKHLREPISYVMNVSRNDWFVALRGEVEKSSSSEQLGIVKNHIIARTHLAMEGHNGLQAIQNTLTEDVKTLIETIKSLKHGLRAVRNCDLNHKVRAPGVLTGRGPLHAKTAKLSMVNKLREKTEFVNDAGHYGNKISREGARAYVLTSHITMEGIRAGSQRELRSTTLFGNDAADRNAHLSLWIMHNSSATNVPISLDHFAHILINKPLRDGIVVRVDSSIDNEDRKYIQLNAGLKVVPRDMAIKADLQFDSPLIDAEMESELSKPENGLIKWKVQSKTQVARNNIQFLNHEMKTKIKIEFGRVNGAMSFIHPKVQTNVKADFDLFAEQSARLEESFDSSENLSKERSLRHRNRVLGDLTLENLTVHKLKSIAQSISPKLSINAKIQSMDRELIPSVKIESHIQPTKSRVNVHIESLPQLLADVITVRQINLNGDLDKRSAVLKLEAAGKGELIAEATLQSDKKIAMKLFDRGLTRLSNPVHAELVLELPTENILITKIYVNPESISKATETTAKIAKRLLEHSQRFIREKSQMAVLEAKMMWSDERHPVYQYLRPVLQGSMENLKDRTVKSLRQYYQSSKDVAYGVLDDILIEAFSTTIEQIVRTVRSALHRLPEKMAYTPVVFAKSVMIDEVTKLTERYFPEQLRVVRQRQHCISLQTCDTMEALESLQEVMVELSKSVSSEQVEKVKLFLTDLTKDTLLKSLDLMHELSYQCQTVKALLNVMDVKELQANIRELEMPNLQDIIDWINAGGVLAKSMLVNKLESVSETKEGALVITVNHPLMWNNFKTLPKLTEAHQQRLMSFYNDAQRRLRRFKNDGTIELNVLHDGDTPMKIQLHSLKTFMKNGMPYQTAMIFGERQIMTFDGKVFAIPEMTTSAAADDEECVHLLARGSRRNNFALIKEKNGITLTVPEMAVSIDFNSNQVRVNQSTHAVQLPIQSSNKRTQVKLVGDTIQVESKTGIVLECRGEKKTCLIHISTGMWDENIGLLGSNDNEADNDFEMLNGQQADNVEQFVSAFELSKKPSCRLSAAVRSSSQRTQCPRSTKCAAFFRNSESEVSACFSTVNPVEFLQACEEESKKCERRQAEENVCDIVNAYRTICAAKHVKTDAPEACETCDGRKENSQWTSRGNANQVDIVVVVSEHKDLARKAKSPAELVKKITNAAIQKLQEFNGQNVRVALVGFSGAGVHKDGHTHTINHQQFGMAEGLTQALKSLEFHGSQETDVLDAIDFVLESHEFRPEATKLMLIFGPAEEEHISGHSRQQRIKNKLVDLGVTVTVFGNYEELKDHHLGVSYDGNLFSTKKTAAQLRGEMPEMKASRLAKATRGAVFQLDTIITDNARQSRLEETAVETILRQVQSDAMMCKTCVCQQTELKQLISACRVTAC